MSPAAVRPPPIAILIAITAIGPLALNIFLPSLPGLVRVFHTDYGTAQLALTLYLVGIACGQLIYGPLSDRFGRRPVLLAGLGVFVIGSLLAALAPSIGLLIGGPRRPGGRRLRRDGAGPRHRPRCLRARQGGQHACLHHHGDGGRSGSGAGDRRLPGCLVRLAGQLPVRAGVRRRGLVLVPRFGAGDEFPAPAAAGPARHGRRLRGSCCAPASSWATRSTPPSRRRCSSRSWRALPTS